MGDQVGRPAQVCTHGFLPPSPHANSFRREARRPLAEFVDPLGGVGLREALVERLARFPAQGLQVRALCVGHRLIAGLPVIWIPL